MKILLAVIGCLLINTTFAQQRDAVLVYEDENNCFDPKSFIEYNNLIFFQAEDQDHGYEIWKTDGTKEGTTILKDINPGEEALFPVPRLSGGWSRK